MKKLNVLDKFQLVQAEIKSNENNYTPHLVMGVETDEDGAPKSAMFMTKGSPFEVLGMIDMTIHKLQKTKKDILSKMDKRSTVHKPSAKELSELKEEFSKIIKVLPVETQEKLMALKNNFEEALKNEDYDELERIDAEMKDFIKNMKNPFKTSDDDNDDEDSDEFDLNDFKGTL